MSKKTDLQERIADSFQVHFNHFGFKKTSVDEVAKEMKISKKTIYQLFDTKEKIFYFVVHRIARGIRRKMEKELEATTGAADRIVNLIRMIFAESRKWLKQNDAFEFRYKYEIGSLAFKDAFAELLTRIVKQGMDSGEFIAAPLEMTIRFIQGIISEGMEMIAADPGLEVENNVSASALKLLR